MSKPPPEAPDWFDRLPKLELHVHLEGAIPIEALWSLERTFGLNRERIRSLLLDTVDQTWLPAVDRTALRQRLRSDPDW